MERFVGPRVEMSMRYIPFLTMIAVFAGGALAQEPPNRTPWLRYENNNSEVYSQVVVSILDDGLASVFVRANNGKPPIEYTTKLSPGEMDWFRLVLGSTRFDNPDRLQREVTGHDGITTINARLGDRSFQATFAVDDAFEDLRRQVFRLIRQAEVWQGLERDHLAYDVRSALRDQRVLQPKVFIEPLMKHIHESDSLDSALIALAMLTTPEEWGGIVAREIESASDKPLREGSNFSRRMLWLNVITGHPFYADLPDSHNDALIRIYHIQSAIETTKTTWEAQNYVRMFREIEARLKKAS
jgi:hypothetical protein